MLASRLRGPVAFRNVSSELQDAMLPYVRLLRARPAWFSISPARISDNSDPPWFECRNHGRCVRPLAFSGLEVKHSSTFVDCLASVALRILLRREAVAYGLREGYEQRIRPMAQRVFPRSLQSRSASNIGLMSDGHSPWQPRESRVVVAAPWKSNESANSQERDAQARKRRIRESLD